MGKIKQLIGLSRKTLQRIEDNGDIASALYQADTVFLQHGCLSVTDLLRPLSLSGDGELRRCLAVRDDDGASRQSMTRTPKKTAPVHPEKVSPADLSGTGQPLKPKNTFAAPADHDSPNSRRIVQKILDIAGQQLKTEQKQGSTGSQSFDSVSHSAEAKKALQWSQMADSIQSKEFIPGQIEQKSSIPFPDTAPESKKTGWFDRHPQHKPAAAARIIEDAEPGIHKKNLKTWAASFPTDNKQNEIHGAMPQAEKRVPPALESTPVKSSSAKLPKEDNSKSIRQTGTFGADEPGSRYNDTATGPDISSHSFPAQGAHSSQLEQLVRKWQDSRQPPRNEQLQAAVSRENRGSGGLFPPAPFSSSTEKEWQEFDSAKQGPIDNDHVFTETLERVLKREIRRHGLEDQR